MNYTNAENKVWIFNTAQLLDSAGESSPHAIKCNQMQKPGLAVSHRSAVVGSN